MYRKGYCLSRLSRPSRSWGRSFAYGDFSWKYILEWISCDFLRHWGYTYIFLFFFCYSRPFRPFNVLVADIFINYEKSSNRKLLKKEWLDFSFFYKRLIYKALKKLQILPEIVRMRTYITCNNFYQTVHIKLKVCIFYGIQKKRVAKKIYFIYLKNDEPYQCKCIIVFSCLTDFYLVNHLNCIFLLILNIFFLFYVSHLKSIFSYKLKIILYIYKIKESEKSVSFLLEDMQVWNWAFGVSEYIIKIFK